MADRSEIGSGYCQGWGREFESLRPLQFFGKKQTCGACLPEKLPTAREGGLPDIVPSPLPDQSPDHGSKIQPCGITDWEFHSGDIVKGVLSEWHSLICTASKPADCAANIPMLACRHGNNRMVYYRRAGRDRGLFRVLDVAQARQVALVAGARHGESCHLRFRADARR